MYEHSVGAPIQLGLATFHKLNAKILWCPSEILDEVVDGEGLERQKCMSGQSLGGGQARRGQTRLRAVDLQNQWENVACLGAASSSADELEVEFFM